jgi:hypothetical protein
VNLADPLSLAIWWRLQEIMDERDCSMKEALEELRWQPHRHPPKLC